LLIAEGYRVRALLSGESSGKCPRWCSLPMPDRITGTKPKAAWERRACSSHLDFRAKEPGTMEVKVHYYGGWEGIGRAGATEF